MTLILSVRLVIFATGLFRSILFKANAPLALIPLPAVLVAVGSGCYTRRLEGALCQIGHAVIS
jgi:hypothetical protein